MGIIRRIPEYQLKKISERIEAIPPSSLSLGRGVLIRRPTRVVPSWTHSDLRYLLDRLTLPTLSEWNQNRGQAPNLFPEHLGSAGSITNSGITYYDLSYTPIMNKDFLAIFNVLPEINGKLFLPQNMRVIRFVSNYQANTALTFEASPGSYVGAAAIVRTYGSTGQQGFYFDTRFTGYTFTPPTTLLRSGNQGAAATKASTAERFRVQFHGEQDSNDWPLYKAVFFGFPKLYNSIYGFKSADSVIDAYYDPSGPYGDFTEKGAIWLSPGDYVKLLPGLYEEFE